MDNKSSIDLSEYQVLSAMRDRMVWIRYASKLKEDLFESYQTKATYKVITEFHSTGRSQNLTTAGLRALLYSAMKPNEKEKFRFVIGRIRKARVADAAIIEKVISRFVQRQLTKQAIMEALNTLDSGEFSDLERVRQRIDEAIGLDVREIDISYNYFDDPVRRIEVESNEVRIPTGIEELDLGIAGGLAAGEIGIWIAPTGVGKTLALVNVGYGAQRAGKKVVHCTLEISPRKVAKRYDARATGLSYDDVRQDPGAVTKRLKVLSSRGAGLHIKDYVSRPCSVMDIRAYMDHLRQSGFIADLLIVDHADLMYTPKAYKERRHELSSIVAGLRRLANELQIPVWTASQATRRAGEMGRTRLWDIAEDIGKANWADLAITISQTDEEKEDGVAWLRIAKSRLDKGNPKFMVYVDLDTMTMRSKKKEVIGERRELRG